MAPVASAQNRANSIERAENNTCIFNGKAFTRGAIFCSTKRILIQCRVPPKDKQDEYGIHLQWMSATAGECETNESKTPQ